MWNGFCLYSSPAVIYPVIPDPHIQLDGIKKAGETTQACGLNKKQSYQHEEEDDDDEEPLRLKSFSEWTPQENTS